jgi:hypothetical protein
MKVYQAEKRIRERGGAGTGCEHLNKNKPKKCLEIVVLR